MRSIAPLLLALAACTYADPSGVSLTAPLLATGAAHPLVVQVSGQTHVGQICLRSCSDLSTTHRTITKVEAFSVTGGCVPSKPTVQFSQLAFTLSREAPGSCDVEATVKLDTAETLTVHQSVDFAAVEALDVRCNDEGCPGPHAWLESGAAEWRIDGLGTVNGQQVLVALSDVVVTGDEVVDGAVDLSRDGALFGERGTLAWVRAQKQGQAVVRVTGGGVAREVKLRVVSADDLVGATLVPAAWTASQPRDVDASPFGEGALPSTVEVMSSVHVAVRAQLADGTFALGDALGLAALPANAFSLNGEPGQVQVTAIESGPSLVLGLVNGHETRWSFTAK